MCGTAGHVTGRVALIDRVVYGIESAGNSVFALIPVLWWVYVEVRFTHHSAVCVGAIWGVNCMNAALLLSVMVQLHSIEDVVCTSAARNLLLPDLHWARVMVLHSQSWQLK